MKTVLDIVNRLLSERAGLLYMFMACVAAVLFFNYKGIEGSMELGILIGAFVKTFLDVVVDGVKKSDYPYDMPIEVYPPSEVNQSGSFDTIEALRKLTK